MSLKLIKGQLTYLLTYLHFIIASNAGGGYLWGLLTMHGIFSAVPGGWMSDCRDPW